MNSSLKALSITILLSVSGLALPSTNRLDEMEDVGYERDGFTYNSNSFVPLDNPFVPHYAYLSSPGGSYPLTHIGARRRPSRSGRSPFSLPPGYYPRIQYLEMGSDGIRYA
ncbi:hypothetical protein K7432_006092 [Basidiobolus ranarum]|uniref:Uncharacterized protein n=1 Tax=Basidiobolus ranarum TaxID=34480 RepID=A0ABR2W251_9FUNG